MSWQVAVRRGLCVLAVVVGVVAVGFVSDFSSDFVSDDYVADAWAD